MLFCSSAVASDGLTLHQDGACKLSGSSVTANKVWRTPSSASRNLAACQSSQADHWRTAADRLAYQPSFTATTRSGLYAPESPLSTARPQSRRDPEGQSAVHSDARHNPQSFTQSNAPGTPINSNGSASNVRSGFRSNGFRQEPEAARHGSDHAASTPEHRKKANGQSRSKSESEADKKRKQWEELEKIHGTLSPSQKTSLTLTGRPIICSVCGEAGHNRRSCPQLQEGQDGKTKKLKRPTFAELEAQRRKGREARKNRPKSWYKGLSWSITKSMWSAQVWDKRQGRTKNVGYFSDEMEAARAYDRAVLEMRGVEAELNFPDEVEIPNLAQAFEDSKQEPVSFPADDEASIKMAVASILNAWKAGVRRQRLEYILPADPDGDSVSTRQEFKALRDLMEATLLQLKEQPDFKGRVTADWLDKSDYVASWQSETLAAVVFCTADCLSQLRNIDGGDFGQRLILVVNPQWQLGGQIISDFGIGRGRRQAESFVSSFQPTFSIQRKRILGDDVRVLKTWDSKWQVHYVWPNKKGQLLIGAQDSMPTYEALLALLRRVPGSKASQTWVERVLSTTGLSGSDSVAASIPSEANSPQLHADTSSQGEETHLELHYGEVPTHNSHKATKLDEEQESIKLQTRPRSPDRFGDESPSRDVRLNTVMSLPEWPRQLLGNAFGTERVDEREGAAKTRSRKSRKPQKKSSEAKKIAPKPDQDTESWVEES